MALKFCPILLIFFVSSCATSKPIDRRCSRFITGTFSSHVEGAGKFITVYRSDTLQLEVFDGETDTIKLKVRWLDPCTYQLIFLNTEYKDMRIMTRIVETKKDYYIYEAKMGDREPISDTMHLVRS